MTMGVGPLPGVSEKMEELGYSALLKAYQDKYGKNYPFYRSDRPPTDWRIYMENLRASKNQDADIAAAIAAVQKSDAYLFGPAAAEPAPASGTGTSAVPGTAKYTADEIAMRKAADLPVD